MAERDRINTLLKIEYRVTAHDVINSYRLLYFFSFYLLSLTILTVFFYFYSLSLIQTTLFGLVFPMYLLISYRLYIKLLKKIKVIKNYLISSDTINAISQGRKNLRIQIKECLGLN